MEKQYCKVGSTTPMTSGGQAMDILEYQYQNFISKASLDSNLTEFFESKAKKIQALIDSL